ncbi:hypothetical protein C2845_PM18G05970 [Panicum miliaceum]|uniref:Uncharacterized protein n=1 Tax=Panicum miliaceum TaxID=4540 RepID=A0A3L6PGL8_PANMI|nr:hypothetical protein C2845_PM18G05970 [Panicum miliaceum]
MAAAPEATTPFPPSSVLELPFLIWQRITSSVEEIKLEGWQRGAAAWGGGGGLDLGDGGDALSQLGGAGVPELGDGGSGGAAAQRAPRQCLSSSVIHIFEWYEDNGDNNFLTEVEFTCPLRRDTFFRYPFVRQLLEGKHLSYEKEKGSQWLIFNIWPVIQEGRGVEAWLGYKCFDPERLDKSFSLSLVLRIRLSESTDIVGAAIDCLRSSASLLDLMPQDAIKGDLTRLPNLQEISDKYAPPWVRFEDSHASISNYLRPDPLC